MKNKFLITTLVLTVVSTSFAFAQEENKGEKFAEIKKEITANIAEEKSILDQFSNCVNSAQKKEDLKACHESKKSSMDKIRDKMKQKREAHRQERKAKLQEQLKKLDSEKPKEVN